MGGKPKQVGAMEVVGKIHSVRLSSQSLFEMEGLKLTAYHLRCFLLADSLFTAC
jgi:hypothetical protein